MRKTIVFVFALVVGIFFSLELAIGQITIQCIPGPPSGGGVTPIPGGGNPNCCDLEYGDFGFKIDGNPIGSGLQFYFIDATQNGISTKLTCGINPQPDNANYITITSDGYYFSWSSTLGIDAIIVKGGSESNIYVYVPESKGDTQLHAPINPKNSMPYGISHIEFCFDYELDVTKSANTTYTRTYNWTITKDVTPATWELFKGDDGTSQYTVSVDKTGYTDSDWAVNGTITITNNTPFSAEISGVSDEISGGITVTPDCGISFPYTLAAGQSVNCTYSSPLPDKTSRTNAATVTTDETVYPVGGGNATADVIFGEPTTKVNDEINVTDTNGKSWGPVSDDATWTYDVTFSEADTINNVATITETGQSDDATVMIRIYELKVKKVGKAAFKRSYNWNLEKSSDPASVTISAGQSIQVTYTITANATSSDHDWALKDTITVVNDAPIDATVDSLADVIYPVPPTPDVADSIVAKMDESFIFPLTVKANDSLKVYFSANLPDASARTDTATAFMVNYSYKYDGTKEANEDTTTYSGVAEIDFSATEPELINECIEITDSRPEFGPDPLVNTDVIEVCHDDGLPVTFTYYINIGPYALCGEYTVENTASFVTKDDDNDTDASGSDSYTVPVSVPCGGCTLTPGYWKTHSSYGPAPYDDTWEKLPNGEETPFFLSNQTWYQVLWTQPKGGNVYYILAHQYIAAKLNFLNGANPSAAQSAFNSATTLFNTYTPAQAAALKGSAKNTWTNLATILDNYNNGLIGPGHCDEDDNTGDSGIKLNDASGQSSEKSKEKTVEKIENDETEALKDESNKPKFDLNNASDQPEIDIVNEVPKEYSLMQNHPNPFNPSTTISFNLPIDTKATLTIYNISGQRVATLVSDYLNAGHHSYQWNIPNNLPAGVYFY